MAQDGKEIASSDSEQYVILNMQASHFWNFLFNSFGPWLIVEAEGNATVDEGVGWGHCCAF